MAAAHPFASIQTNMRSASIVPSVRAWPRTGSLDREGLRGWAAGEPFDRSTVASACPATNRQAIGRRACAGGTGGAAPVGSRPSRAQGRAWLRRPCETPGLWCTSPRSGLVTSRRSAKGRAWVRRQCENPGLWCAAPTSGLVTSRRSAQRREWARRKCEGPSLWCATPKSGPVPSVEARSTANGCATNAKARAHGLLSGF